MPRACDAVGLCQKQYYQQYKGRIYGVANSKKTCSARSRRKGEGVNRSVTLLRKGKPMQFLEATLIERGSRKWIVGDRRKTK